LSAIRVPTIHMAGMLSNRSRHVGSGRRWKPPLLPLP
jgi:hypothetical protein